MLVNLSEQENTHTHTHTQIASGLKLLSYPNQVIAKKLLVTSDGVKWPEMYAAEFIGKNYHLNLKSWDTKTQLWIGMTFNDPGLKFSQSVQRGFGKKVY